MNEHWMLNMRQPERESNMALFMYLCFVNEIQIQMVNVALIYV